MTISLCSCYSYKTTRKSNYDRHIQSNKHKSSKLKGSSSLALISIDENEQNNCLYENL
jgi:hypothetical protein